MSSLLLIPVKTPVAVICSFFGEDAARRLERYLTTRGHIAPDDYLFISEGTTRKANRRSITGLFARTIEKLGVQGKLDFEQKNPGKPRSVRLYNLRKFFRKYAWQAGADFVNFWMGHKTNYKAAHIPSSDSAYLSKEDIEYHRAWYIEKAWPHLRLETPTATEHDKIIQRQAEEIAEFKKDG